MLLPTIMMNLTTAIGAMADTMIIGHYLDDASLSVVTFATPIYQVINAASALLAVGGCIAMSIDSGKGMKDAANKAFSVSIELLAFIGLTLAAGGLFFSRQITGWLGAGADVFDQVEVYAKIVLLGAPIFTLNIGLAFFVRNDGSPTLSMAGMLSSTASDIILNFVLVGVVRMGVAGAALSTVLGQVVSIVILLAHFFSKKNTLKLRPGIDGTAIRVVKNGGSAALQFVYQFACVLIINHLLAGLAGTSGVVLYTVVFNLSTVTLSTFEGISQTIQPMVSSYYGEKSYLNIRGTMRLAFITILLICGAATLLLEIYPQVVPLIFGIEDADLIAKAAVAVRIYGASMIITTINVVIGYYLQSIEQSFMAAVLISLRSFVLFLAAVLVLGKLFGINGIWAAYIVAETLTLAICAFMIRQKRAKLSKKGEEVNGLLLEKDVEAGIVCLTWDCSRDDFGAYSREVSKHLPAEEYLARLASCISKKKGRFIETEINHCEGKAFIRDNLKHDDFSESLSSAAEYGPVLGWNRLCIKP